MVGLAGHGANGTVSEVEIMRRAAAPLPYLWEVTIQHFSKRRGLPDLARCGARDEGSSYFGLRSMNTLQVSSTSIEKWPLCGAKMNTMWRGGMEKHADEQIFKFKRDW